MALQFLYDGYFAGKVGIGTDSLSSTLTIATPAPNFNDSQNAIRLEYVGGASPNDIGPGIVFAQKWWSTSLDTQATGGIYGVKNGGDGAYGGGLVFYTQPNSGADMNQHMIINSSGNVGIGTSLPDAILNISKTSFSTTFTSADSYIRIGKGENATNGYQFIGFGYNNGSADLVPAYIGYQQTGTPGNYTKGDLVFGTRNVTTNTAPTERMRISSAGGIQFNSYGAGVLVTDASGNITAVVDPPVDGITFNNGATITNQINTDVDTGTETIASVAIATHDSAFFDFVIKKTTNVRSGTVYACHDGTTVQFTETSTQDLGDTSDVTLSVDISGTEMRLRATTTSDNWSIKSLIRAI